jgi:hypothetical protein
MPNLQQDAAVCVIMGVFFLASSAGHMVIFQLNKRHGRLFVFSAMLFALCLIRGLALFLRLAWAATTTTTTTTHGGAGGGSGGLSIAANTFTAAGTPIVFVVNIFFAQRLVRAFHPQFGWSMRARVVHRLLVAAVVACLVMSIVAGVETVFTLEPATRSRDRTVLLLSGTLLAVLAFVPVPVVALAAALPRGKPERFGTGSWTAKVLLLVSTSLLLTLGAIYRVASNWATRPLNDPAWYHGRAPYYICNFVVDLVVSSLYLAFKFHQRFYVPSKCKGPGSYSRDKEGFNSFENLSEGGLQSREAIGGGGGGKEESSRGVSTTPDNSPLRSNGQHSSQATLVGQQVGQQEVSNNNHNNDSCSSSGPDPTSAMPRSLVLDLHFSDFSEKLFRLAHTIGRIPSRAASRTAMRAGSRLSQHLYRHRTDTPSSNHVNDVDVEQHAGSAMMEMNGLAKVPEVDSPMASPRNSHRILQRSSSTRSSEVRQQHIAQLSSSVWGSSTLTLGHSRGGSGVTDSSLQPIMGAYHHPPKNNAVPLSAYEKAHHLRLSRSLSNFAARKPQADATTMPPTSPWSARSAPAHERVQSFVPPRHPAPQGFNAARPAGSRPNHFPRRSQHHSPMHSLDDIMQDGPSSTSSASRRVETREVDHASSPSSGSASSACNAGLVEMRDFLNDSSDCNITRRPTVRLVAKSPTLD